MQLTRTALACALLLLCAAPQAQDLPVYDQIEWSDPLNKRLVTLANDDFLITGGRAFEIWNAQTRARRPAAGWPAYTSIASPWARVANGTVVAGRSHDELDRPFGSVVWWNPSANHFGPALTLPGHTEIEALIGIDATLALVCMRTGMPDGAAFAGSEERRPRRAALVEVRDGTLRWAVQAASMPARLIAAGVRGPVDGVGKLEQPRGEPAPALTFNTSNCSWAMRNQPAELAGTLTLQLNQHHLPDGRLLVVRADGHPPQGARQSLRQPVLWDEKKAEWTPIGAPGTSMGSSSDYSNFGPGDPVVSMTLNEVKFLDPVTLRWEKSVQNIAGGDVTVAAPMQNGAAVLFQRTQGKVMVANPRGQAPEKRSVQIQPSAFPVPRALPRLVLSDAERAPLTRQQVEAITREARRRARQETPFAAPWESLDRIKLARLIAMPEYAAIDARAPLVDTAAAWEVMPFDKPSDAQSNWDRLLPGAGIAAAIEPDARSAERPHTYYQDGRWGPEAGAQVGLLACLPAEAWRVKHMDPMLWSLQRTGRWTSEHASVGKCIREQGDESRFGYRESARGRMSAAVLEQKLIAYLLSHGCKGTGPDSCLIVLNALVSLNSAHPGLPDILALMKREIEFDRPLVVPTLTDQDRYLALNAVRQDIARRQIYLSEKISVLMAQPESFPDEALMEVMRDAARLDKLFQQAAISAGPRYDELGTDPAMQPVQRLRSSPVMPLRFQQMFARLGTEAARARGCKLSADLDDMPQPFWYAYVAHKLAHEQTSCKRLFMTGAVQLYERGFKDARPDLVRDFTALKHFLAKPGRMRNEMLESLKSGCPSVTDPWGVCRDAARAKALAEARAQQAADRALAKEEDDRLKAGECSEELTVHAGSFLEIATFANEDDSPVVARTCRRWPGDPALILSAFAYNAGVAEQKSILIALIDKRNGNVVASHRSVIIEDAISGAEGLHLDMARYQLSPTARAFGVGFLSRGSGRAADGGFGPTRTLYIREGAQLRPILGPVHVSHWSYLDKAQGCSSADECEAREIERFKLSLAVAKTETKGLADLIVTGKSVYSKGKSPRPALRHVLRYDGKVYPTESLINAEQKWAGESVR